MAVINGKHNSVELLIEAGCDIDHPSKGKTVIQIACKFWRRRCAQLLVDHGCDLTGCTNHEFVQQRIEEHKVIRILVNHLLRDPWGFPDAVSEVTDFLLP